MLYTAFSFMSCLLWHEYLAFATCPYSMKFWATIDRHKSDGHRISSLNVSQDEFFLCLVLPNILLQRYNGHHSSSTFDDGAHLFEINLTNQVQLFTSLDISHLNSSTLTLRRPMIALFIPSIYFFFPVCQCLHAILSHTWI